MKNKPVDYTDGEIGEVRLVADFLPPPDQLVLKDDAVKVTLALSRQSIAFFKARAAENDVSYQRMIRAVVDGYVERHSKP